MKDIRVIDLSMWFAGPMASRLLGDMGAEIIKVESIKHMDPWRGPVSLTEKQRRRFPERITTEAPYNAAPGFNLQNRNKRGITLDLGTRQGKALFKRLVETADVVLENYSPKIMGKLGFEYDVLKKVRPDIILMSMPAFGRTGPDKDYRAFGQTIDCVSGMAYRTGYEGEEPMLQSGLSYGDPLSGMNAAFAILSALHHRRKTGEGMHIELSQVEGLIAFNADSIMDYTMNGRISERMGNHHPVYAPHNTYPCSGEDEWVAIAVSSDEEWIRFCQAAEKAHWVDDARFCDVVSRRRNQDELDGLIAEWTVLHRAWEIAEILQQVEVAAGPVLNAKELVEDPHYQSRGFFETVTHPEAGTHPYIGMYAKFSKTPGSIRTPAPRLGEDNGYVFGELLGLTQDEMDRLAADGIIGTVPSEKQQGGMY